LDPRKHNAGNCPQEGLMAMLKANVAFLQCLASKQLHGALSFRIYNYFQRATSDAEYIH
jgi:hypothetical protein